MAYFGDATSHAAILGVALALAAEVPIVAGVMAAALAMAGGISALAGRNLAADTLLGVAAHAGLAGGLVAVALTGGQVDLEAYLFGEILAVGRADLALIWAGALAVIGLLAWRWKGLLIATLSPDLAVADGLHPARERLVLMLALATVVAVSLKVVGALLITSMLIVPAAAARPLARSPEGMAAIAVAVGAVAVVAGLRASFVWNTPSGPSIVLAAVAIFALAQGAAGLLARR
jgi:zinc transport system permease protein